MIRASYQLLVYVCVMAAAKKNNLQYTGQPPLDPLPRPASGFMRVRSSSSSSNKNGRLFGCRRSCPPPPHITPHSCCHHRTKPLRPPRRDDIIGPTMLGDNCCGRIDLRSPAAASHPGRYIGIYSSSAYPFGGPQLNVYVRFICIIIHIQLCSDRRTIIPLDVYCFRGGNPI